MTGIATAKAIVNELELYSVEIELPSFPVNVLETTGKPPRVVPALAVDKLVRPAETSAAVDASEEPESTVLPE
jgi:hypothetical protein